MPDPVPEAVFDEVMARAGLTPTPEERADLIAASAHLRAMLDRLRPRGGVEVEPALIFAPQEAK